MHEFLKELLKYIQGGGAISMYWGWQTAKQ